MVPFSLLLLSQLPLLLPLPFSLQFSLSLPFPFPFPLSFPLSLSFSLPLFLLFTFQVRLGPDGEGGGCPVQTVPVLRGGQSRGRELTAQQTTCK